jgi:hypothetical protein
MKKSRYIMFCTLLLSLSAFAQNNKIGKISGIIQTNENKALSATVFLMKAKDSTIAKTGVANQQGEFEFENIAEGKYFVQASAVGYNKYATTSFYINVSNPLLKSNQSS